MSRATIVFLTLMFLIFSSFMSAEARPLTTLSDSTTTAATKSLNKGFVEESCEGVGKEECLMRRTLADAHLDYIYTQDKNP